MAFVNIVMDASVYVYYTSLVFYIIFFFRNSWAETFLVSSLCFFLQKLVLIIDRSSKNLSVHLVKTIPVLYQVAIVEEKIVI